VFQSDGDVRMFVLSTSKHPLFERIGLRAIEAADGCDQQQQLLIYPQRIVQEFNAGICSPKIELKITVEVRRNE